MCVATQEIRKIIIGTIMHLKKTPRYTGKVEGDYNARTYFDKRLHVWPNLRGTGHRRFSLEYNEAMYQVASDRLKTALNRNQIFLRDKKVLDIGPGVGYFIQKYIEWGAKEVVAIDIAPTSIQILREKFPGQRFIEGDISQYDLTLENNFDLVFAISVIFHITDDGRFEASLENMCRAVKPGGYLIVVDSFSKPIIPGGTHVRLRPFGVYSPILEKNGFKVIEKTPMYFVMGNSYFPILIPKILSWPPVIKRMMKLDYWIGDHFKYNFNGLKYLVTQHSTD